MHRITHIYTKLYLYIITILVLIVAGIPILLHSPDSPPPFVEVSRYMAIVMDIMIKHSNSLDDLKKEFKKSGKEHEYYVTLYDKYGEVLFQTEKNSPLLDEDVMARFDETGVIFLKGQTDTLIKLKDEAGPVAYIYVYPIPDFLEAVAFFCRVIIIFLAILLVLYPLSKHITKPIIDITEKAVKFSSGDFSSLEVKTEIKGKDEIARLHIAFDDMAEKLVAMIEEKKELISDISHELGSPLGRMQLAVEMVEDYLDNDEKPPDKIVKKLSKNIKEMSKLVDDLLNLSRMSRAYNLNKEIFNVEKVLEKTIGKFQHILDSDNIKVKITKEGNINNIKADKIKIERVIQNLFGNASDHTGKNTALEIEMIEKDGIFSFTIKDEGPGIKKENCRKIFEPFFREDPSRNRKTGGTGLGLAIVKKIIDLHEGKIMVLNPGEKGATIKFEIKAA